MNHAAERRSCKAAFDMLPPKALHLYDFCLGLRVSPLSWWWWMYNTYSRESKIVFFLLRPVGEVSFIKTIAQEAGPNCFTNV